MYSTAVRISNIVPKRIMRFFTTTLRLIFATSERPTAFLIDGLHWIYDAFEPSGRLSHQAL
jgi:hypothetical protein